MKKHETITTEIGRYFLTDHIREVVNFRATRQSLGVRPPPAQKAAPPGSRIIPLPNRETWSIPSCTLQTAIAARESHRQFTAEPLSLDELAFLLWATQGVRAVLHEAAVPERTEWRYAETSYKVIALDAGHVCQNLYLACEAIGTGTCAIADYNQTLVDELLGVDGYDEFGI